MSTLSLPRSDLEILRRILAVHVPDAEVWAYGSRVNGTGHEGSDLDLVLRNPSKLQTPVPGRAALLTALKDSNLTMLVDVFDWASLPENFQRNIERQYVVIQEGGRAVPRSHDGGAS